MRNISDFLQRFSHITPPDDAIREEAKQIIKKETNIDIKKECISVRGNTLFLSIPPVQKNEIFLKKEYILNELNNTLSAKKIQQLR